MASSPLPFLTAPQYLENERANEFRSEYLNGEMFAMSGASVRHNLIANAIGRTLYPQLKGRCSYFLSDVRLHIPAPGLYTYPDLLVICGEIRFADTSQDVVTNPVLLVEILSPGTQDYDRGRKFEHYRSLPSLRDYVAVAQEKIHVEHHRLEADGSWSLRDYKALTDTVHLPSINASLTLAEIYDE